MRKKNIIMVTLFWVALAFAPATYGSLAVRQVNPSAKELVPHILYSNRFRSSDFRVPNRASKAGWSAAKGIDPIAYLRVTPSPRADDRPGTSFTDSRDSAGSENSAATLFAGQAGQNSPLPATPPPGALTTPSVPPATPPGGKASPKPTAAVTGKPSDDYRIGAGDVLHINVWKELDVPGVVVRFDGRISIPLIKDVVVAGLTPPEAEELIAGQLSNFLDAPDVTVIVAGMNSKKVYFIGAVEKQGPIAYTYRMTILQAISEAGGVTEYAHRKKIYVLRNDSGTQKKISIDYDAVLKGKRMDLNIPLLPGDTVVVP